MHWRRKNPLRNAPVHRGAAQSGDADYVGNPKNAGVAVIGNGTPAASCWGPWIEEAIQDSGKTASEKLRTAIRWHVDAVAKDPERTLVVFHQWRFLEEPNRATALAMRRRYADAFFRIIDQGKASGEFSPELDTRVSVFGILGALNWVPEWYDPNGTMPATKIADRLSDTLINGLGNTPSWSNGSADAKPSPSDKSAPKRQRPASSAQARGRS